MEKIATVEEALAAEAMNPADNLAEAAKLISEVAATKAL